MEIEDQLYQSLIDATKEVLQTELSASVEAGERKPESASTEDVTWAVNLTGSIEGTLAVTMGKEVICKIASKILNTDVTDVTSDATYAVGEIVNKIALGIKKKLAESSYDIEPSSASTISEGDLEQVKSSYMTAVRNNFSGELCEFDAVLMYKIPKPEDKPAAAQPPEEGVEGQPDASAGEQDESREGPRVILNELEKTGSAEAAGGAAPATEISDDMMSEAMKKLEEVIKELKKEQPTNNPG